MTKSMTRIKHNLLKHAFYRYMLWMSVSLLVLFFIIYLITVSFHQKRDENLKEINLNFYTEIMMMKNATDNMLALLYAEQPDLEDLRQITNLSLAEYYEYKTTTYMKHAGSKYNGTQNFVNQSFKMNDYLSTVVIYHAQTKRSVVFHKELHKETDLSYAADVYFYYDISPLFEKIHYQVLRNNGNIQVFYKNNPIPPEIKPKYVLDQRQAEHYVVTATTKYANVFTEYSLIYTVYSFFAILVFLGFFPFLFQYLQKIEGRLSQLTQKITKVKTGNFDPEKFAQSDDYKSDDAISLISSSIDELAYQLNDQIHQVYKSKIKQKDYQIQSIRSQINPHFLYNTLEAIRMKAELNEDHAVAGMLLNAATLYRKLIKGKDVICLAEELEYCDAYLSLFEIRFEDALFYDIVCDPSLESLLIEKFTIQPIIENFIHHGIDSQRQDNFIEIHCFEKDDRLYIEVVNNGKPIPKVEKQRIQKQLAQNSHDLEMTAPTGLFGVDYRIKQRFGHQYGVTFTTQEDYVKFQITMPKKRGGEIV